MFVPLDNLYEWISGISTDVLIYRFSPHGSRNLSDLCPIDDVWQRLPWPQQKQLIPVICHDQEPLDYQAYSLPWQVLRDISQKHGINAYRYPYIKNNDAAWKWIASQNLSAVVDITVNDTAILLHSEQRSSQVELYQKQGFKTAYWWSHAMIARDWYRFSQLDPRISYKSQHAFDFNIYARAWSGTREYRLKFLELLIEHDLVDHARISFGEFDNDRHYQTHMFTNPAFTINADLSYIKTMNISSCRSAHYDVHHYGMCSWDVVLETLFDDQRLHLTEKVLRPIACGKPFILAATPGSLDYLKGYGFRTFHGIIDESYDRIQDPLHRLHAIISLMSDIASSSSKEKTSMMLAMKSIVEHNSRHFFSNDFAYTIKHELWHNVKSAIQTIKDHHQTGKRFGQWVRLLPRQSYDTMLANLGSSRSQVAQILRTSRKNRFRK
jgi:hypothetical protein